MTRVLIISCLALTFCGCTHDPKESTPEPKLVDPVVVIDKDSEQVQVADYTYYKHVVTIKCEVSWGQSCHGWANYQAVPQPGYTHCRTDGEAISGPSHASSAWKNFNGNIGYRADACGGTFYDQYGAWVTARWTTYMVPTDKLGVFPGGCRTDTQGTLDGTFEMVC